MSLEQRLLHFFTDVCPLEPQDALLLAVSGGPDSMALLHLSQVLRETLGIRLEVAHLNHGLRGAESDADARFVAAAAGELGLAFHERRVDLRAQLQAGGSVEALARDARYAFFSEARAVAGARWVVTGHSADDQVETFLMNMVRGAGPRGLGGMLAVGPGSVCRPLLTTWRAEILAYLEEAGIEVRHDASNDDVSLTRNRVRHHLVPLLSQAFGSNVTRVIARESQLMNELDDYLNLEADRVLVAACRRDETDLGLHLDIPKVLESHRVIQRSTVRAALELLLGSLESFDLAHVDSILDLMRRQSGGAVDLPRGVVARREHEVLWLGVDSVVERTQPSGPLDLTRPGTMRWGGMQVHWRVVGCQDVDLQQWSTEPNREAFDPSNLLQPVYLRGMRPGDRLEPFGMDGTSKVSDLLIDRKVPRRLRTRVALLCDNGGPEAGERILWVTGQRRSRHAPVGPQSTELVLFEAETIV